MTRYEEWIAAWLAQHEPYGKCAEATTEMAAAFPELRRVRGHYLCPTWGECEHWWLVAPDGTCVDPTATQFPSRGAGLYNEWDESQPEPTGMCLDCGEYVYNGDTFCSAACERSTRAYMGI